MGSEPYVETYGLIGAPVKIAAMRARATLLQNFFTLRLHNLQTRFGFVNDY